MKSISGAELEKLIDGLIRYCDEENEPPVAFIVRKKLGLGEEELDILRSGEKGKPLREAVLRLDEYRTYFWIKKGLGDPKWATFSTFNIKELRGEGEDGHKTTTLRVVLDGVGSDAFD